MPRSANYLAYLLLYGALLLPGCASDRPPEVNLVPLGYQGPLMVHYRQAGYPPLPHSGDSLVFDFRPSPVLRTSSTLREGSVASDAIQYYYVDGTGRRTRIRKVADAAALRAVPLTEPCLVTASGVVSQNLTGALLTSAQNLERTNRQSIPALDSLLEGDTVSMPLQ